MLSIRLPGGMYGFIIKRLLLLIPIFFAVSIVVFMLLPLTGDPARQVLLARGEVDITEEKLNYVRHQFGFHRPLYIQYIRWIIGYPPADPAENEDPQFIPQGLLRGDLGRSYTRGVPVSDLMRAALPTTLS